jgi:predicted nucleic-acid-binding protein
VNLVVLAEVGWGLRTSYKSAPAEIATAIEGLLRLRSLIVEQSSLVLRAAAAMRHRKVDFGDALIGVMNAARHCEKTLTFDEGALRLPWFERL